MREAITIAQAIGCPRAQARALCQLGLMGTLVDPGSAQSLLQQAVATAEEANDDLSLRKALTFLALNHHFRDDREAMLALADRALSMSDPGGNHTSLRWCLWSMAHAALAAGELDEGRRTAERARVALAGLDPSWSRLLAEVLPGRILLTVELHAKEQWIPDDPTTTGTATVAMDTLQKTYEDAYYADARACRDELNNLLKGLAQHDSPWRTLPDPPPELINSIDVLRSLVGQIEILAKTDPARAARLRQALAGAFGINPAMSAGLLTGI